MKPELIRTRKDFQNLWCMAIVALGGKARKEEIVNWVGDLKENKFISFPDNLRHYWACEIGYAKEQSGFKDVVTYCVNNKFWYLTD